MCLLTNRYIKHIVSPVDVHVQQNLRYNIKLDIARRSNVGIYAHNFLHEGSEIAFQKTLTQLKWLPTTRPSRYTGYGSLCHWNGWAPRWSG